jgi:hypothetical protein
MAGRWEKGQSGNPGGRPKGVGDLREIARSHTPAALNTLIRLLGSKTDSVRLGAAIALLDRGWGKPHQEAQINVSAAISLEQLISGAHQVIEGEAVEVAEPLRKSAAVH